MYFNSFEFLFIFLPSALIGYYLLCRWKLITTAKAWLIIISLLFYTLFEPIYLPLLLISIAVNFAIGRSITVNNLRENRVSRKLLFILGIVFNILLLGFYKYSDFFITNINMVFTSNIGLFRILFPIGISFFTFQQITFLVDSYRGTCSEKSLFNYAFFVSFFPKILAGPIVRHDELMPQFNAEIKFRANFENIARGLFLFSLGLFKKTGIADYLSPLANAGFDASQNLNFFEAWFTSLAYTFQLYFDFSGYTDMALGTALMFNFKLPINFNSPYKSLSIQDFWRRWHITLSRFLRDYIYIPLGGNRVIKIRLYYNIIVTFIIGGIWHGAGWTFILWGLAHGIALMIQRIWNLTGIKINRYVSWFITFNFINAAWVLFRARNLDDALKIYRGMIGANGVMISEKLSKLTFLKNIGIEFGAWLNNVGMNNYYILYYIGISFIISLIAKNTNELSEDFKPKIKWAIISAILLGYSIININQVSEFIYMGF